MIAIDRTQNEQTVSQQQRLPGSGPLPHKDLVCSIQRDVTEPLFDENFLHALARRDADAENFLIAHFSRPVHLKLRSRLRSVELIQDAQQETFLRVLRYFHSGKMLDNPSSLPGFIHSVCHNVSLEFLRAHTRHSQLPENSPETADPGHGPEALAVTEERRRMVGRIMSDMPEKDRELLRRVCLNEEDKDMVCREFQVDRGYLRVLLHRARNRFRTAMSQADAARGFSASG